MNLTIITIERGNIVRMPNWAIPEEYKKKYQRVIYDDTIVLLCGEPTRVTKQILELAFSIKKENANTTIILQTQEIIGLDNFVIASIAEENKEYLLSNGLINL